MQRLLALLIVGIVVVTGIYLACRCCPPGPPRSTASPFPGIVACPDHDGFDAWVQNRDSVKHLTSVKLAGPTTLIPEFHDCQRLIDTTHRYGPLVALWVPAYLESLDARLAQGQVLAVAVVHSWDGDYQPLGIHQGWNCLLMFVDQEMRRPRARMVQVADQEQCYGEVSALAAGGQLLEVHEQARPGFQRNDYPSVGRWDRDLDWAEPYDYIGLRCGAAWCDVHREKANAFLPSPDYTMPVAASSRDRRVFEIKGWYDEQFLDAGNGSLKKPLSVRGTMVPDPALDTMTIAYFTGAWRRVGMTALSGPAPVYTTKLGLTEGSLPVTGPPDRMTQEFLCLDDGHSCPEVATSLAGTCAGSSKGKWYARIQPPTGSPIYKCVTRHGHEDAGQHIPGTGRWSWQEEDATQWWRCDNGCCAVKP